MKDGLLHNKSLDHSRRNSDDLITEAKTTSSRVFNYSVCYIDALAEFSSGTSVRGSVGLSLPASGILFHNGFPFQL